MEGGGGRKGGVYVPHLLPHCHCGERKREEGGEEGKVKVEEKMVFSG